MRNQGPNVGVPWGWRQSGSTVAPDVNQIPALPGAWTPFPKLFDESVTADAVMTEDSELVCPVVAGGLYVWRLVAFWEAGASGGFQGQITVPASPTKFICIVHHGAMSAATTGGITSTDGLIAAWLGGTNTDGVEVAWGLLINGANDGNLALSWAQYSSNATPTVVKKGSILEVMPL